MGRGWRSPSRRFVNGTSAGRYAMGAPPTRRFQILNNKLSKNVVTIIIAPRAPALNLLTARGGLETAFQKKLSGARSRYALLPRCADLCPCHFLLPPPRSYSPRAAGPKCQKARPRLTPTRPPPPPWLPLSVAARPPSQRIALALRSQSSPTCVLAGR